MKTLAKRSTLGLAVLALGACTVVPYDQARPTSNSRQPVAEPQAPWQLSPEKQAEQQSEQPQEALVVPQQPEAPVQVEKAAKSLPAAERMRQLASAEGDKGDYKRAIALLERALRISPRDPETYYELARNHLLMDNPSQALQLAQRGLSHKPSANQRSRLEQLIEDCRSKLTA